MIIVGFGYKSRAGKDTAAQMLVQKCRLSGKFPNVQKVAFATKLKQVAHDLYGIYGLKDEAFYERNGHLKTEILPACGLTPTQIWIALGDTLKKATYEPLWADHVFLKTNCDVLVISDVRYPREAERVRDNRGFMIRVDRDAAVTRGSDSYLDNYTGWDATIRNNGTLAELDAAVEFIFDRLVLPRAK